MYIDIPFPLTKAIPIMFERVTIDYQTLYTWIGHNTTPYHNFNALPHALPHTLSYIYHSLSLNLAWLWPICNLLPRATVKFIKRYIYIYILFFLKKMTVTR